LLRVCMILLPKEKNQILIPVVCCMLRWMLLGGRVGLGIVTCPFWRSASSLVCLFLLYFLIFFGLQGDCRFSSHTISPPCSGTTCLVDIAWLGIFYFFCLLGYRGIVHPLSDDEGTERTWFEPEQRPRKRVPERSVHGKQSPQGASKTFWRQDDQP